ncbi:MAG: hypothetical protein RL701_1003 [Pseudomonadota bacterium]|jgi:hypothetical protein
MKISAQIQGQTHVIVTAVAYLLVAACSACSSDTAPPPTPIGGIAAPAAGTTGAAGKVAAAGTTATAGTGAAAGITAAAGTGSAAGTTAVAGTAAAGTSAAAGSSGGGSGAGASAAGMSGSAAGAPAPSGPATFTAVLAIFASDTNNCVLCHGMATIGGGLIFKPTDKQGSFTALVGTKSAGASGSQCAGKTYVIPGNPDGSLLYEKLAKEKPSCGAQMPATGTILKAAELATVRAWIMAGAKND